MNGCVLDIANYKALQDTFLNVGFLRTAVDHMRAILIALLMTLATQAGGKKRAALTV